MNVLFVTWAGGGNSTPVLGLATRLIARGHEVKVASPDDMAPRFDAVGIDYEVIGWGERDVVDLIERESPSLVVDDFMMPTWLNQTEASGRPYVALVHTLYDRLAAGLLTAFTTLDAINDERRTLGLAVLDVAPQLLDNATRVLVTSPPMLDSATQAPGNTRWIGAILEEPASDAGWQPPVGDDPLVIVSLGTTEGLDEGPVLERFLEAVREMPVRACVSVPPHLGVASHRVPNNVTLCGYVRHAAVMPHASAMVNHAGLGSILAALTHGVPMVSIPLDRDQPHNAARVRDLGVGVVLERDATAVAVRNAIDSVLRDERYRDAARPFVDEYDPTASTAITELEAAEETL